MKGVGEGLCLGNMFHQELELVLREGERLCHLREVR